MDRDALWGMVVFLEVVERGSLAAAARSLQVTPSAVSKQTSRLEERLGVRLLQRTTRSLRLTPAGARYRDHAARVVAALAEAEADLQQERRALRGVVRVSAPAVLGEQLVAPVAARFVERHPEVDVVLDLTDRFVDLVKESIDVAVRVAPRLPESGLTVRPLGATEWYAAASPAYLARRGTPRAPRDLAAHDCLELAHATDRGSWRFEGRGGVETVSVRSRLTSTSLLALHRCACEGAGVGRFPDHLIGDDLARGRLVRVLPQHRASHRVVHVLTPSRAHVPPRVRAFVAALGDELKPALSGAGPRSSGAR